MKTYVTMLVALLCSITILPGCKKSDNATTPPPKDYNPSIKNKTWWGVITYTGKVSQYYSVHFNADNTLLWSQQTGDFNGQWALDGKSLTITLPDSKSQIKADITDDDQLSNISDNTTAYIINNGALLANPNITLDNTKWTGISDYGNPAGSGTLPEPITLTFSPGFKLNYKGYGTGDYIYTRSASGAVIRWYAGAGGTQIIFGIIVSATEIKGNNSGLGYPWQVTKQ